MRLAYADPPYPGQSKRHYGDHPDYAGEVDHEALAAELLEYEAWAMSTSSTALRDVLALFPSGVRVGAWVKPYAAFKNQPVTFAWEPVIYKNAARPHVKGDWITFDWIAASPPIFRGPASGVKGEKPREFCFWLFDLLRARPGDDLVDMFPGSGAVARYFNEFTKQPRLAAGALEPCVSMTFEDLPGAARVS